MIKKRKIIETIWRHYFVLESTFNYSLKLEEDWQSIMDKFKIKRQELYDHEIDSMSILFEEEQILVTKQIEFDFDRSYGFDGHVVIAKITKMENSIDITITSEKELDRTGSWGMKISAFLITLFLLIQMMYGLFKSNYNEIGMEMVIIGVINIVCMIVNWGPTFYTDPMYKYVKNIIQDGKPE